MKKLEIFRGIHQYEGHLKRLIKLKYKAEHPQSTKSCRQIQKNKNLQSLPSTRLRTQNVLKSARSNSKAKESSSASIKMPRIVPLVSKPEQQLLSKSLEVKKMPSKEAELVLQNYLLSRRILAAKPVIQREEFRKAFRSHQKYSGLISRSRKHELTLSQSRLSKYREFESREKLLGEEKPAGAGRFLFNLEISQLQTIVRNRQEGRLYNLVFRLRPKKFRYTHLSLANLKQPHSFLFRKKDLHSLSSVVVELELVSSNDITKFASFNVDASAAFDEVRRLERNEEYFYERRAEIGALKSGRTGKLMGTVAFAFSLRTH